MVKKIKIDVEICDDGPCAHIDNPLVGIIYGRNVENLKKLLEDMSEFSYNISTNKEDSNT